MINKNNKGFTLIELLATIVIIALVATIATISVTGVLNNTKKDINTVSEKELEKAKELYFYQNKKELEKESRKAPNAEGIDISTLHLIKDGYISESILDSKEIPLENYLISYDSNNNTTYDKVFKGTLYREDGVKLEIVDNTDQNMQWVYLKMKSTDSSIKKVRLKVKRLIKVDYTDDGLRVHIVSDKECVIGYDDRACIIDYEKNIYATNDKDYGECCGDSEYDFNKSEINGNGIWNSFKMPSTDEEIEIIFPIDKNGITFRLSIY